MGSIMKLLFIFLLIYSANAHDNAGSFEEIKNGFNSAECYLCHIPINNKPLNNISINDFYEGKYLLITSQTCLSCHDGTSASAVNVQNDNVLQKHHPISVRYDSSRAYLRKIHLEPGGSATWTLDKGKKNISSLLKDGKIECSSCHNPHLKRTNNLRVKQSDTVSSLCFGCHDM